jgi:hypothetical protein
MPLYNEERQGETPTVRGAGGGSLLVDWQKQPTGMQQSSQILGTILQQLDQEDQAKQKKQKEQFDMYKTLREAGYDTKAAFEAMSKGTLPTTPPGETTKELKDKADLARTESMTKLDNEKAAAYARGDIGKRQTAAQGMNSAQLQRELKRVSDPFTNEDYDSEETKSYVAFLNQRLQQLSQYTTPDAAAPEAATPQDSGKIKVIRLADGKPGSISAKFFDPKKYKRA